MAAAAAPDIAQILKDHDTTKKTTTIPLFYGKDKDTVTGKDLIRRINEAADVAGWNADRKLKELRHAVRERAQENVDSFIDNRKKGVALTWDYVVKEFLAIYDPRGTAKTTCTVIADLHQKPGERVADYYGRVNTQFRKILETRPEEAYTLDAETIDALPDANKQSVRDGVLNCSHRGYQHIQQLIFVAGLNDSLRHKTMEAAKNDLHDSYHYALGLEILLTDKKAKLNAVQDTSDPDDAPEPAITPDTDLGETEEEFEMVNAFRAQRGLPLKPRPKFFRRSNYSAPQHANNGNSNNGNGHKKDFRCRYCKKMGHTQTECRKRIREGGQCVDESGKPWKNQPKVNEFKATTKTETLNYMRDL